MVARESNPELSPGAIRQVAKSFAQIIQYGVDTENPDLVTFARDAIDRIPWNFTTQDRWLVNSRIDWELQVKRDRVD